MNKKILFIACVFAYSFQITPLSKTRRLTFYLEHLKKPLQVGSITPSSQYTGNCITQYIKEDCGPKRILEIGAGPGSGITDKIIQTLLPSDHFTIIEINAEFVKMLQEKYGHLQNVTIVQEDVLKYSPNEQFNYIISTLPLTVFDTEFIQDYHDTLEQLIAPSGIVSYIQYIGLPKLRMFLGKLLNNPTFANKMELIEKFKEKWSLKSDKVLRNCPPTWIHHLQIS